MRNATGGTSRFDEFKAELGIADNILSNRLNHLVEHGLLTRTPYRPPEGGRTRHEYRLTKAGEDLLPILHAMLTWGNKHTEPASPAGPMRLVHSVCDETIEPGKPCRRCGYIVPREEVAWIRPWRSEDPETLATAERTVP
jgi:DNA-binding HxlR family transcriptional regulator